MAAVTDHRARVAALRRLYSPPDPKNEEAPPGKRQGLEAWQRFGTSRLAADVHALRRAGWNIVAEEVPVQCREGRSARVAVYRLANTAGGRQ